MATFENWRVALGDGALTRPTNPTQTYATADATHAARTHSEVTDNSTGTASTTIAAMTNIDALTDSTGGSASNTLAAITGGGAGCEDATKNAIASIAAELATQRTLNTAIINAIASLAAELNNARTDSLDSAQLLNQVVDNLQALGMYS